MVRSPPRACCDTAADPAAQRRDQGRGVEDLQEAPVGDVPCDPRLPLQDHRAAVRVGLAEPAQVPPDPVSDIIMLMFLTHRGLNVIYHMF